MAGSARRHTLMAAAMLLTSASCSTGQSESTRRAARGPHVPAGSWHTARQGESLSQIAGRFAVPLEDLEEINGVHRSDRLPVGTTLFVPRSQRARGESVVSTRRKPTGVAPSRLLWPLQGGRISSRFGKRRGGRRHEGLDISAPAGTPVLAAAAGKVIYANSKLRGYGELVVIRHAGDLVTVYAHNRRLLVREGQRVRGGEVIAEVGKTGRATGFHLHFEVRKGDRPVDPLGYVAPP